MTLETYKVIHIIGLILLALGLGGMLSAPPDQKAPRWTMIQHGLGVLILFGAGFGMMAKSDPPLSSPGTWHLWLILKMVIWFVLAALPSLIKHKSIPRSMGWLVVILLGGAAAYLGIVKPFAG